MDINGNSNPYGDLKHDHRRLVDLSEVGQIDDKNGSDADDDAEKLKMKIESDIEPTLTGEDLVESEEEDPDIVDPPVVYERFNEDDRYIYQVKKANNSTTKHVQISDKTVSIPQKKNQRNSKRTKGNSKGFPKHKHGSQNNTKRTNQINRNKSADVRKTQGKRGSQGSPRRRPLKSAQSPRMRRTGQNSGWSRNMGSSFSSKGDEYGSEAISLSSTGRTASGRSKLSQSEDMDGPRSSLSRCKSAAPGRIVRLGPPDTVFSRPYTSPRYNGQRKTGSKLRSLKERGIKVWGEGDEDSRSLLFRSSSVRSSRNSSRTPRSARSFGEPFYSSIKQQMYLKFIKSIDKSDPS